MAGIPKDKLCNLDSAAFSRFGQKLSLSGYNVPDPHSVRRPAQWDDKCPSGCWLTTVIYNDFVNTHGMYTAEPLHSYKGLDLYSLYHAGHIHTVIHTFMHTCMHA